MTRLKYTLVLLLAFAAVPCQAAAPTPEEIIAAFFGPYGIGDKPAFYTGEMMKYYADTRTVGERLKPGVTIGARRLPLSAADAPVYAVDLRLGSEVDNWYAYFAFDGGSLKLGAVRVLGSTGFTHRYMEALEKLATRTEEQEWMYQVLKLTLQADGELIAHFRARIADLDALKSHIDAKDADATHAAMRSLHFRGYEYGPLGHLEIWIGGGLLNSNVGVLFAPPSNPPPAMSPDDYIYIERIDGPWYLYKTT